MHSVESLTFGRAPGWRGPDVFVLKDRLQALFSHYGRVQRLDLVRADQAQSRRVMCFLRMSTPQEEQAVADALGLGRFGGDLVMVLPLDEAAAAADAPHRAWSTSPRVSSGQPGWR